MSESMGAEGPALNNTVQEVQGIFPSDATLQEALSQLGLAGYDRSDFSLPEDQPHPSAATPNEGAENPTDDVDKRQVRTMGAGMAGYIGAAALAGATVATGGAAGLAAAAAVAVGVGTGAATAAAGVAADQAQVADRDRRGAEGTLVLAVRTRDQAQADQVIGILRQAGATRVEPVTRTDQALTAGVSAASWTG